MKISEAAEYLTAVVNHNLTVAEKNGSSHNEFIVPIFIGDPGLGKTAIPKMVAKNIGIRYFETIVAQYDAGEMAGLPSKGIKTITYTVNENGKLVDKIEDHERMIRLRPDYLPDIFDPEERVGIYNLDELPQAFLANQNVCSQIVNEWRVGKHEISRGITICATGNKPENKAGTTSMPMHLRDRLNFIKIESDLDDWLIYAATVGIDYRIRAFLKNNSQFLHQFTVGADASPTPRSWDKSSAILKMDLKPHLRTEAIAGQIGAGATTTFETWIRVEDRMPKIEDVINHPETAPVFGNKDAAILYLLLGALADGTTKKNVTQVLKYIDRLPNKEFAAIWASDAFNRDKTLLDVKEVTSWKLNVGAKLAL